MSKLSILDMHRLLDQELQSMAFFTDQGLETEEIDLQLNAQIDNFIEAVVDKYRGKAIGIGVKEGFQTNQVSLDSLRTIHIKDNPVTLIPIDENSQRYELPSDYLHYISSKINWSIPCKDMTTRKDSTLTGFASLRIEESQDIDTMRKDYLLKTSKESPIGEIAGNSVFIYNENLFTLASVKLDYIRKPAVVVYGKNLDGSNNPSTSTDCDLPPTVHRTIVKMTAIHIASIIESTQQKITNLQQVN